VRSQLLRPLQNRFGADLETPWFKIESPYEARRLEMDNGDLALFAWGPDAAYWLGNTETPKVLWQTDKYTFQAVPDAVAHWGRRELTAALHEAEPWLADYPNLSRFFLPVLCSKDGAETTRAFLREHAAGFPDADRDAALGFYEALVASGIFDDHEYVMGTKLGTSAGLDTTRMRATMGEYNAAKLLTEAGHGFTPEVELDSGHALDFRVEDTLVEVTRPLPVTERRAGTPASALRDTVDSKTGDQLRAHEGAVLFVDATSFPDDEWRAVRDERPKVGYRPAVVFRMRPDGRIEGFTKGSVPLDVAAVLD
jgi:hypothetical protein